MQGTITALAKTVPPGHPGARTDVATVRYVLSPIPDVLGRWHTEARTVAPGHCVRHYLPKHQGCIASINGGIIPCTAYDTRVLHPDEELLLKPLIGIAAPLVPLIGYAVASIVAAIAVQFIVRALFPPQRPKFSEPDDATYTFEGIRSTVGPGAKVPVIYGRHRVGGQIIQAFVESGHYPVTTDGVAITYPISESETRLFMLLALGEGEMTEVELDTVELNGQPLANFPNTTTEMRLGTPTQTTMGRYHEAKNSFADGREITEAGILYTTTTAVDGYQFTIAFEEGLARFTDKGEKISNKVIVRWRHRVNGTTLWNASNSVTIEHSKTSVVRAGVRRDDLPRALYDIEFSFEFAASQSENSRWRPFLESVMEIVEGIEPYPNTALLSFTALATENLSGAIPNVTVVVKGTKVRVGSFSATPTYSENPAWCLMDFMTNDRYGLGIPDAEINLPAFQVFADYCNATIDGVARHRLNLVLVEDAEQAILQILAICRGVIYKIQGQWTPVGLQDEPPVQLLSWSNCTNVRLSYTRDPDHINVMEGRFADMLANWEQSVITWPVEEDWPVQLNKTTIDLRGITDRAAVERHLQYELNRRRLPKLTLTMDCSLDALALTVNDIFRFSHPLPGWGTAGRLQEGSTVFMVQLDEPVTFEAGQSYHVYIRHDTDLVETRAVVHPGPSTQRQLQLVSPLLLAPTPLTTLYAFGESSPLDTAIREFRVVKMERLTDNTIRLNATQHNASIYDDAVAVPLPVTDTLFNPLGPPPALTGLILAEFPRVGPDGRSRTVANLSWDVEPLSPGHAPYGGAIIYRREISLNAIAGLGEIGEVELAEALAFGDVGEFIRIANVGPAVLDFDDPLVITGITYEYRIVPMSMRGVPNNQGSVQGVIHISGPTTPEFFPGTVENLRLRGQAVGDTLFEGRDVHLVWDRLVSPLFNETFFLKEYVVEVWAPAQLYLLRRVTVTLESFTYTYEQNFEDQIQAGFPAPRRDLLFHVRARTNTGRVSLLPATLLVNNPPPDMSNLVPIMTPLFNAAIIDWTFYIEPRDLDHYDVKFDTITPPIASLSTVGVALRKVFPQGLTQGVTYYAQIVPYDSFGIGIASGIGSVVPLSLNIFDIDTTPPGPPTGLALTTGTTMNPDGTLSAWVEASWTPPGDTDLAGHQINFRVGDTPSPTVFTVDAPQSTVRIEGVPGAIEVFAKVAAFDGIRNFSAFTDEESIITGSDTTAPGPPSLLTARGFFRAIVLSWQPPADADLSTVEIWANRLNNRNDSGLFHVTDVPGTSAFYQHGPLDASNTTPNLGVTAAGSSTAGGNQTYTLSYWIRAKDLSGNVSEWHPVDPFAGITATTLLLSGENILTTDALITQAAQIASAVIDDAHIQNLSAGKILAGTIRVLLRLGVGHITLDAPQNVIRVTTPTGQTTVEMGLLDPGNTATRNYGLRVYDPMGVVLFDASQNGVTANGIQAGLIQAHHIAANIITATHLRTDIAVITVAAQIANALIDTAHIKAAAIVTAHIQDAAITSAKIASAQILNAHIADAQIDSAHIGTAQITSAHIQDAAITRAKIQDLEVTNAKIENLTIGTEKVQDNAITNTIRMLSTSDVVNTNAEQVVFPIALTDITPDATVVLNFTALIQAGAPQNYTNNYILRIRENSLTGPIVSQLGTFFTNGNPSLYCGLQGLWTNLSASTVAKNLFVTSQRNNEPVPTGDEYTVQGQVTIEILKK